MMNCDLLLSWMTHIGEGSWAKFRSSVEELAGPDADVSELCRRLRIVLSDLGFADFFVDDTQEWRIAPALLGGLPAPAEGAVLCGSRTPYLVDSLVAAAKLHGCEVCMDKVEDCPTLIRVEGSGERLAEAAKQIDVSFEPNLPAFVAQEVTTTAERLQNAVQEPAPLNWKVRSFDFGTRTWIDNKLLSNSACEYTPTYGRSRYFVHRKRGRLLRVSKRESLYMAAMLKGVRLIEYDPGEKQMKVPLYAPLPEGYSRAACLCSGRPAEIVDGQITFGGVPPDLAAVLAVAAGQPHPEFTTGAGR